MCFRGRKPITTGEFKRRLTAILSADVEGYSRLMRDDEEATVRTIASYREIMSGLIHAHNGRVLDAKGDNVLAEFASVVDAVRSGAEIQKALNFKNEDLPENRRMRFRIGINLGDVIEEKGTIYGDGVNVAARLEGLAEGGGICISGKVYEEIKNKIPLGFEYLGEQSVKNIDEPVRVYRVLLAPEAAGKVIGRARERPRQWRWTVVAGLVLVVAVGAFGVWRSYQQAPKMEKGDEERMAFPLPDKPSIAVLPFTNMSDDPKQEYFSDGMAEDLITDLSKISGLFVIARNSVFQYKGKPVDVKRMSRELGVRYVLEGSVRRAEDMVRINAQLIDTSTGGHLWAERYDGTLKDVFALQDKITGKIVAALAVRLASGEADHLAHKGTGNPVAYDSFLQGWAHYVRFTPEDFSKAVPYFEKAVELDPQYGRAYAALASIYWESFYMFWHESLGVSWNETRERADRYIELAMKDPSPLAHLSASKMLIADFEHDKALATAEKSMALDPNDPSSHLAMAYTLIYAGRGKDAVAYVGEAMRLDPLYPPFYLFVLGLAYFGTDRFEEAAAQFERVLARNPENYVAMIPLAAAYGHLGRGKEAAATTQSLRKAAPMVTLSFVRACPLWKYKDSADKGRLLEGLEKAGLPDSIYDLLRRSG